MKCYIYTVYIIAQRIATYKICFAVKFANQQIQMQCIEFIENTVNSSFLKMQLCRIAINVAPSSARIGSRWLIVDLFNNSHNKSIIQSYTGTEDRTRDLLRVRQTSQPRDHARLNYNASPVIFVYRFPVYYVSS